MEMSRWIRVLCVCILFCWIAQPAVAFFDPGMVFSIALFSSKPGYQKTAQDFQNDGNFWKEKCTSMTALYNERLRAYVRNAADAQNVPVDMNSLENPSPRQRAYLMSTGFHAMDPTAAGYYENMMLACDNAQKSYSQALLLTKDDDYEQKAEIFEDGAGIYTTLGMPDQAQEVNDAAAVARAQDTASDFFALPLPGWLAVLGVLGGLFVLHRRKN